MDWFQLLQTFGLAVFLIVLMLWFAVFRVWPYVIARQERADADRQKERDAFFQSLALLSREQNAQTQAMNAQAVAMREMTELLRQIRDTRHRERGQP